VELVCNTVSLDGKPYVTDMWRYTKRCREDGSASFIYDTMELLPPDGEAQARLRDYTFAVLEALQIANGPAHAEIMDTQRGCVLVEVAARMHGGNAPSIVRDCIGQSQIDMSVDVHVNQIQFLEKSKHPYVLAKHCLVVFFISPVQGRLCALPFLDDLRKLEGFCDLVLRVQLGEMIHRTSDLFTCPGWVVLSHDDPAIIRMGERCIREMESIGFFAIQPS
jgi:hypothetical protein